MAKANIQFENLRIAMAVKNYTVQDLADAINVNRDTMGKKLARKSQIYLSEACDIQKKLFPEMTVEKLFEEIAGMS